MLQGLKDKIESLDSSSVRLVEDEDSPDEVTIWG